MNSRSDTPPSITTRFAPSPTGNLHLGHAYSALLAFDFAARGGGRFLLRLEDIDPTRCRLEFEQAIEQDLDWLGIRWSLPVLRQSERLSDYAVALESLDKRGLTYPCFCTRKGIAREISRSVAAPHGPEGSVYPGLCRNLAYEEQQRRMAAGVPYAIRLDLERALAAAGDGLTWLDLDAGRQACRPGPLGDVILARKDTPTSYHLAVTIDDAAQEVSHVIRGADLFHATHIHRLLQALLDLPVPDYRHHKILEDAAGQRLSKRQKSLTLRALRDDGVTPADIRRRLDLLPRFIDMNQ